jgi:hypothetical protein
MWRLLPVPFEHHHRFPEVNLVAMFELRPAGGAMHLRLMPSLTIHAPQSPPRG